MGLLLGASCDHVIDGLIQLVSGALDSIQVVANRSRNGLFNGSRFLWHKHLGRQVAKMARFVILDGGWLGVNRLRRGLCPIVSYTFRRDGQDSKAMSMMARSWLRLAPLAA